MTEREERIRVQSDICRMLREKVDRTHGTLTAAREAVTTADEAYQTFSGELAEAREVLRKLAEERSTP